MTGPPQIAPARVLEQVVLVVIATLDPEGGTLPKASCCAVVERDQLVGQLDKNGHSCAASGQGQVSGASP